MSFIDSICTVGRMIDADRSILFHLSKTHLKTNADIEIKRIWWLFGWNTTDNHPEVSCKSDNVYQRFYYPTHWFLMTRYIAAATSSTTRSFGELGLGLHGGGLGCLVGCSWCVPSVGAICGVMCGGHLCWVPSCLGWGGRLGWGRGLGLGAHQHHRSPYHCHCGNHNNNNDCW